jgi:hypothetical protein
MRSVADGSTMWIATLLGTLRRLQLGLRFGALSDELN